LANFVGFILKVIFSRSRPDLFLNHNLFGFFWFKLNDSYWSFPSGHTITIISVASGLSVLFARFFYPLFAFAILIVLTRVLLYYHYLSDVMMGFYLSIMIVGFFAEHLKKHHYFNKVIIFTHKL
jgi:membrane-associated phospholipid phosphatase